MRDKIVITGSGGFLGSRLADYYKGDYDVIEVGHTELEITNQDAVMRFLWGVGKSVVLHCAAISDTGICERNPELSEQINVAGSLNIAAACKETGSKLILMSSDQIYTGCKSLTPNCEEVESQPVNRYGKDKMKAESQVLNCISEAVCLRLTWMYDLPVRGMKTNSNLMYHMLKALVKGEPYTAPVYEYRGITDVHQVVGSMERVWKLPGGVYNYGSPNSKNTYDSAKALLFLLAPGREAMLRKDENRFAESPRNLAMNIRKIEQSGIQFTNTEDGFVRFLKEYMI